MIRLRFPGHGPLESPPRTGLGRLLADERFVRGLGLGALIGAAIAGSTLWTRRRETGRLESSSSGGVADHEAPRITR